MQPSNKEAVTPEPKTCKHKVVTKFCFRCKRPDLAGPEPKTDEVERINLDT